MAENNAQEQEQEGVQKEIPTNQNEGLQVLIQAVDKGRNYGIYSWDDLKKIIPAIELFTNQDEGAEEGPQGPVKVPSGEEQPDPQGDQGGDEDVGNDKGYPGYPSTS